MSGLNLRYVPPGAVAAKFMASFAPTRGIMGPFGSGKTVACLLDPIFKSFAQAPSPVDGVRRWKSAVIRDTYPNLEKTTMPSWFAWIPKDLGHFRGERPPSHTLNFGLPDGTQVEFIMEFIALGEHRVEDVMRGWEGTHAYLNEADRLDENVLTYVAGRLERYPSMIHGGPSWNGITFDMNAPDTENWTYERFVERNEDGDEFFVQPSGFSAGAENLANLKDGYYDNLARGKPDWWIRRFIRNQWGYSRDGKPVYPEFNDGLHVAKVDLVAAEGIPLIVGADAGLTPAAVVKQRMPNGQWRTLEELVAHGMGPKRFGGLLAKVLKERYSGFKVTAWADPAAAGGVDKDPDAGERSWIDIVSAETGIRFRPAPTNRLIPRLESVRQTMVRMIDGEIPGYLMSPRCKVLRKAYNSGYRFRRVQVAGPERWMDLPEKNESSHPADADQYAHIGGGEYHEVMGRKAGDGFDITRQTHAITDDNPTGSWTGGGWNPKQAFAITDD